MKTIWNTYKIWILIGLVYIIVFVLKLFNVLNHRNRLRKLILNDSSNLQT